MDDCCSKNLANCDPAVTCEKGDRCCKLSSLSAGSRCTVRMVGGDASLRRRLLEMGFCGNTCVEVIRRAPMGGPIEYRLRGYCLSLRAEQAQHVEVISIL